MPRPPIALAPDQVLEVETLAALLNQDQIADYFGIARKTFQAIRNRDPEVDARYKKGKAKAIAHVANGLLQKARGGDTTSMIFYLKTQAGWRETTLVGRAPEMRDVTELSDAALEAVVLGATSQAIEDTADAVATPIDDHRRDPSDATQTS